MMTLSSQVSNTKLWLAELFWSSFFLTKMFSEMHPSHVVVLTLTYLGYFASLNSWGGGGHYGPPPKISTMDGPINLKIGTDTE